jgi:DNA-binding CsgD family transcriptional regulator
VLPAAAYSWDRVRTDTTLAFAPAGSLHPAQGRAYWLRLSVRNSSHYAAATQLTVLPNLDNTLYQYDQDARAWRTRRAGATVATDSQRVKGKLLLCLPAHATTTVYVRISLGQAARLPSAVRLQASLEPVAEAQRASELLSTAWAVSLGVLGVLLLTNVPTYVRYRDRPTLFYICLQVGAVLYITAYRSYFRMLWPAPIFSQLLLPTGYAYAYTLNNVLMHLSVVLMLGGFVQMTRAYLATPIHLPRLDAVLRRALGAYVAFTVVVALVNLSGFLLNYYTIRFDNVLVVGLMGLLLLVTVVAYRRRLPLARTYLLANVLPLLSLMGVASYHVAVGFGNDGVQVLPDLTIVLHALFFSAALSVRLQLAQRTLLATEREAAALALDIQQKELRNREIILKNKHIQTALLAMQQRQQAHDEQAQQLNDDVLQQQATNQDLQQQLEANQRELASSSLYVQQKNALLAELKIQIQELGAHGPGQQQELSGIKSILQTNLYLDDDWQKFRLHFEQVHPRFFEELQARYPALTSHEQRLYSYFHINLSTKEIAALLNIDPASVRRAKTRLFKKIATADQAAGRSPMPAPQVPEKAPPGASQSG